jgi:hypothetical protein
MDKIEIYNPQNDSTLFVLFKDIKTPVALEEDLFIFKDHKYLRQ